MSKADIVPTFRAVNSAKSDHLPDLEAYFDAFAQLHYQAVRAVAEQGRDSLLEDYVLLFRTATVADLCVWSLDKFRDALYDEIAPQVQIARNMGFAADWRYAL